MEIRNCLRSKVSWNNFISYESSKINDDLKKKKQNILTILYNVVLW